MSFRSLFTGVSGLKSHQTRMDVVGNNISNVNTYGFKRRRAAFQDVLGQSITIVRSTGVPNSNPASVGLGVNVGSISADFSQGGLQTTNIATDLALNGDGFFVVENPSGRRYLTRAGNFDFNDGGQLVSSGGLNVQGYAIDQTTGDISSPIPEGIKVDLNVSAPPLLSSNIFMSGNLSADAAVGDTHSVSTVVYDAQGKANTFLIEYEKTADNEWGFTVQESDGTAIAGATGTLTFDVNGNLDLTTDIDGDGGTADDVDANGDAIFAFDFDIDGDASDETFTLNFGGVTRNALTQFAGSTTGNVQSQDGRPSGSLTGFSINNTGELLLNFSNGFQQKIYQVAIGMVRNPNGLESTGDNLYAVTSTAGDLHLGKAGQEFEVSVISGTLEMSNVDLATEFTEMIVTQRGFQASARVITTADEFLQETVSLKR